MPERVDVPISDLLLDQANARFKEEQPNQQAAMIALAELEGAGLIKLAQDIIEFGLDPVSLPCVVATGDQRTCYRVLEGNRRVLALKALDTPSLVSAVLEPVNQKRLAKLAATFANSPIEYVPCVLFDSEADARHWIILRHTGRNDGAGLAAWGPDETDRYLARHGEKPRSTAGQIVDFVEKHVTLSPAASAGSTEVSTNWTRLLSTPEMREKLGLQLSGNEVHSLFPTEEVAKGLAFVMEDLRTGRIKVGDIYTAADRRTYASSIPAADLPDQSKRLPQPVPLADLTAGATPGGKPVKRKPRKKPTPAARTALIPKTCNLTVPPPRINALYFELSTLNIEQYPNVCSIGLRLFLELSVAHYIRDQKLMTDSEQGSASLAKRLKLVAGHLKTAGKIDQQLEVAMQTVADGSKILSASTVTFNQYVHNQFVFPKAVDLRSSWDELQPFMEALWP